MSARVFIDGEAGTMGLQIRERLETRRDIELVSIDPAKRKDADERKRLSTGPVVCEVFTPPYQDIIPTVSSVRLENGSMKSKPIHEMAPFMSDEMVKKYEF